MLNLTPFLLFDDNCPEAMTFYQSCLGGELIIATVGDTSRKTQVSPRNIARLLTPLKSDAVEFSATGWQHQTRAEAHLCADRTPAKSPRLVPPRSTK